MTINTEYESQQLLHERLFAITGIFFVKVNAGYHFCDLSTTGYHNPDVLPVAAAVAFQGVSWTWPVGRITFTPVKFALPDNLPHFVLADLPARHPAPCMPGKMDGRFLNVKVFIFNPLGKFTPENQDDDYQDGEQYSEGYTVSSHGPKSN